MVVATLIHYHFAHVYDEKQVKLRLLPTLREEMSNVILGRLLTLLVDTCIPGAADASPSLDATRRCFGGIERLLA